MDFNLLLADLRGAAQQYCQKISDKYAATVAYCEVACKTIDKLEGIEEYENKVIGLWIILGYIEEMYARLTGPVINHLCQKLFRHCARTVLNIQWQQLVDNSQSKQNFRTGLNAFHAKLSAHNNTRFSLILDLMETGWTHPTLGLVMAEEEDNEEEECLNYIKNEDPVILKIRVEIMIQENCEEFALNLCSWCLKHPALTNDLDIRQTQLMLLHKLNQQDRLQEECQKIPCHDGVRLISRLQQTENNKSLCTELAQTFLIQDWIRPSDHCNSKDLLTLWIRHQYQADQDQEKFLSSVWAVAKLSRSTEQIGLIIDGLREECGDMFLQLYTDLCIFAINYDKSCLEKHMQEGDMEGLRSRQQAMAATSEKLSQLYSTRNPKTAMYAAVTAFALNPNQATLATVKSFYVNQSLSLVKDRGKECCSNCANNTGRCDHKVGKINPATFFEVERLLNMLRPYYLNPDHDWLSLGPACDKYLAEREAVTQNFSNEDLMNHDSSSVSEGSIPDLEGSPQVVNSQRTLLHQHLVRPVPTSHADYSDQITQVSKHLKPFTAVTSGTVAASNRSQPQDATSSISGIEPTLQLSDAELGDKHTLIKHLLFSDTINELLQQGSIDLMPEAFQEITIDNSGSVPGSGSDSQDMNVPIPGHMKHTVQVSAADPLFTSLNLPTTEPTPTASTGYQQLSQPTIQLPPHTTDKVANHAIKSVQPPQAAKPAGKLVPTPATVTSHSVKNGTSSAHQAAGQLNNKVMSNCGQPAATVTQKAASSRGSVGSAVFRITSGLLRVPTQAAVVPTPDHTVVLQNQTQTVSTLPVQQIVAFQGGQMATQPVTQAQCYTGIAQTVPQQVVQHQVLNLIGTSPSGVQQLTVPLHQQAQLTPNLLPTTLSLHPTSTVAQIAPSIAAQLSQPQIVDSQVQMTVAQPTAQTVLSSSFGQQMQQKQIKPQAPKPQHMGKPQLAGLAPVNRGQKVDVQKPVPTVSANIQQVLKTGGKPTVSLQQGANNTVTYTSTNFPHVARKTKTLTYPVVKKKSNLKANTAMSTVTNHTPTTVTAETESNVPFVLKSSLSKPKPKPKSKATIFTNSMISTKMATNTALLGGNGDEKLTCVKPMLGSGSTVSDPDAFPHSNVLPPDSTEFPKTAPANDELVVKQNPSDPNYSANDKPKKASKKLFSVFYQCKICNELVLTQDELRKHIQTVCRADEFAPFVNNSELADINKANKQSHLNPKLTIKSLEACKVFQCPVCKVYCVTDPEVLQHRTGCLKSRCRPRKKPDKPKTADAGGAPVTCSSDSVSSSCESSVVSEIVLNEMVQTVDEKLPGPTPPVVHHLPQPSQSSQQPQPAAASTPKPSAPPPPPETKPVDLASLDLTNTEDLKKFIEHFKQQEMLKEKSQPTVSKSSKKTKKVEVPKAVVSVMSGVVDNVEAAAADVPLATTPATKTTSPKPTSPTKSSPGTNITPSEPKPVQNKPKVAKVKKIPNPKYKELVHKGNSYFKCFLCKQTFCRMESLESHWADCYESNGPIRKPKKIADRVDSNSTNINSSSSQSAMLVPSAVPSTVSSAGQAVPVQNTTPVCVNSAPVFEGLAVTNGNIGDGAPTTSNNTPPEESKTVSNTKVKGNVPKVSPSKPKPPVQIDGAELAKYEDVIQSVIDSAGVYADESEAKRVGENSAPVEGSHTNSSTVPQETGAVGTQPAGETPKKIKKKPKPLDTPRTALSVSDGKNMPISDPSSLVQGSIGGVATANFPIEAGVPVKKPEENSGLSSLTPGTDGVIKKKKKKKPKTDGGENTQGAVPSGIGGTESQSPKKKKKTGKLSGEEPNGSPAKKSKKPVSAGLDNQNKSGDKPSPKKRSKPIPKKKHVNVKQMLKDRLECILSGKKDQCDVRSDGVSVPLSQRTKGRPKPQILSETKQVIIIVGLEWGCGCSPCGTLFRNHRNLIQHLVIKHLQPYTTKKAESTTCHLCQQSFLTFIAYLNHTPQHSEIILEQMDALIEEKGESVVADVEKSPEKEDSEENYVPFPDIQEALNDMLKIRQQQTHGDDGMKIGTDVGGDVNLLSPSSDPAAGFQQVALPASMSLDSLHEFLPDPSKENVDELAAFARMINDPISHTDIGRISEQESIISDGPKENALVMPAVQIGNDHCVEMTINEAMLVGNQQDQIPANSITLEPESSCLLGIPEKSIQMEDSAENRAAEDPKPSETSHVPVKIDELSSVPSTTEGVVSQVETGDETVNSTPSLSDMKEQEVERTESESIHLPKAEEMKVAVEEKVETNMETDKTVDVNEAAEQPCTKTLSDIAELPVGQPPSEENSKSENVRETNEELTAVTSTVDSAEHAEETTKETNIEEEKDKSVLEETSLISVCNIESVSMSETDKKSHEDSVDISTIKEDENEDNVGKSATIKEDKNEDNHVKSASINEDKNEDNDVNSATINEDKTEDSVVKSATELKAIVKHLRSHPRKTELVTLNETSKGTGKTEDKAEKNSSKSKSEEISESKRILRQTGVRAKSKREGKVNAKKDKSQSSRRGRMAARRAVMKEDQNGQQPDRVYKLRKTIPAKQFYRNSMKMKPRMSRSSILDVLHGNRKLNVMRSRGHHPVDNSVVRTATDQTDESKALIKRTAARAHSAKFVTRSSARHIEQGSDDGEAKCAQLPESPNKDQNVSMRTRATIKKNKFGLKSFEVRLNNMSAETVRRKSLELARNSSQNAPTNRRSSCDVEMKPPTTPVSRTNSCEDDTVQQASAKPNPTSPSFLDSFLSYLNTRKEDEEPFPKKKPVRKRTRYEQVNCSMDKNLPSGKATEVVEAGLSDPQVEAAPVVEEKQECEVVAKNEEIVDTNEKGSSAVLTPPEESVTLQKSLCDVEEKTECVIEPLSECRNEENDATSETIVKKESAEDAVGDKSLDISDVKETNPSEAAATGNDTSKSENEMEEDEVILLEEFSSRTGAISKSNASSSNMEGGELVTNTVNESQNQTENKPAETTTDMTDKPFISPQTSEKVTPPAAEVAVSVNSAETELQTTEDISNKLECKACPNSSEMTHQENQNAVIVSNDNTTSNDEASDPTASSNSGTTESAENDDKLKGVKSLREKVKTEPFTWDVDDEEDQKLAERNERSLKALRQQVSIGPFTWDMEEDERGHVIAGIEQVQIPPVASCSVTRNTRSGRRRIVKLSTDSRDSGGSIDSDKKEGSIECEATLTTVTWNVEVNDNAVDDDALTNSVHQNDIVVTAPLASSVNSADLSNIPVVGRATVDGVNCIRVVPSSSFKRKQPDSDSSEVTPKKPATAVSSVVSSPAECLDSVADTVPACDDKSDNSGAVVSPVSEPDTQNNTKGSKKSVQKTVNKESAVSKDAVKSEDSVMMTRQAARDAAGSQPSSKKARTTTTSVGGHLPAMVRRSAKQVKYSSKYRSTRGNPPPRVQVIRVDPVLEGVTTRRTRHGSSERTVHTPVPLETMQSSSAKTSDHKWTINKRKNFAYQFSRARRDRKSY